MNARLRCGALAIATIVLGARLTLAQTPTVGSVRGVVYDSIVGAPLAGAEVWLEGFARTAFTDATGAFRIDSVPAAEYRITFGHASLDSLAFSAPVGRMRVEAGRTMDARLATPSALGIARALCPGRTSDSTSVLFGAVRDATTGVPRQDARVEVRWRDVVVERGISRVHAERGVTQTVLRPGGRYAFCQVPNDAAVEVRAVAGSGTDEATGRALVDLAGRVLTLRDLQIGIATQRGSAAGAEAATLALTIVDAAGLPVAGAQARVGDDSSYTAASDAGRLRATGLAAGPRTIDVRAIGYEPARVTVDLAAGREAAGTVTLPRSRATVLDAVRVIAAARASSEVAAFDMRRRAGGGYVIDRDEIERRKPTRVTQLFQAVPGLRVQRTSPTDVTVTSTRADRGSLAIVGQSCPLGWIIDGRVMRLDPVEAAGASRDARSAIGGATRGRPADVGALRSATIDDFVSPADVKAIEIYPGSNGPQAQYGQFPCGVVMIWTRATMP